MAGLVRGAEVRGTEVRGAEVGVAEVGAAETDAELEVAGAAAALWRC